MPENIKNKQVYGLKKGFNCLELLPSFSCFPLSFARKKTKTQGGEVIESKSRARFFLQNRVSLLSPTPISLMASLELSGLFSYWYLLLINVAGAEVIRKLIGQYDPGYSIKYNKFNIIISSSWFSRARILQLDNSQYSKIVAEYRKFDCHKTLSILVVNCYELHY